jgi:beta-1,4-mannosyl-glycoprotein beta-1,4-N-acetylglucosaminyltransferase
VIYDCFMYNGMGDDPLLLELRLATLSDVVDRFVLVEANSTHSGETKPLYYRDQHADIPEISRLAGRIIPIAMTDLPISASPTSRENIQRAGIMRGLRGLGLDDWVIISDLDELPRPEAITAVANANGQDSVYVFAQRLSYYYLNCIANEQPWHGSRMIRYPALANPQSARFANGATVGGGGWHMSYLGGAGAIIQKVQAYMHQEFNIPAFVDTESIERKIADGHDLFDRPGVSYEMIPPADIMPDLPAYFRDHQDRYGHWMRLAGKSTEASAASIDADTASIDAELTSIDAESMVTQ